MLLDDTPYEVSTEVGTRRGVKIAVWSIVGVAVLSTAAGLWWNLIRPDRNIPPASAVVENRNNGNTSTQLSARSDGADQGIVINATAAPFADTDDDGLLDELEALYGTDAQNPDTDDDQYADGIEVEKGYEPLNPAKNKRMVDLALVARLSSDVAGATVVSSGLASGDHQRYYLVYDGVATLYYAADGTRKAECHVGVEPSGVCATLPNELRTDFSRTLDNGRVIDSYHLPFS